MARILNLTDLKQVVDSLKKNGKTVVHCHGTFDLLHPGHLRHFKEARRQGDILIVTVTASAFVKKAPDRPYYSDALRLESIEALEIVDYVALHNAEDAVDLIKYLKPSVYIKGEEYRDFLKDVTGKIQKEAESVESVGGKIYFTGDPVTMSSSRILNKFFDSLPFEIKDFVNHIKNRYTIEQIYKVLDDLKTMRVLVVGDAIIDEYQYVEPIGQSGKGVHLTAKCKNSEMYAGGGLAVANQLASFSDSVATLTGVGKNCPHFEFVKKDQMDPKVGYYLIRFEDETLVKKRYVQKDGDVVTKLFETYSGHDGFLSADNEKELLDIIENVLPQYDIVVTCDYGNGLTTPSVRNAISKYSKYLALNAQINSGNRGYHVVTHYPFAHYVSLNEPELRLTAHDKFGDLETIRKKVMDRLGCEHLACTRGTKGLYLYNKSNDVYKVPALNTASVDRVGAGDSFFGLSAMVLRSTGNYELASFLGAICAAINVTIVANARVVSVSEIKKFIATLLK